MTESSLDDTPPGPSKALTFTPVPRLNERHDGWTPERQQGFIEALADYGSVRAAANSVGLAPEGAYRLRRQPGAEEFAAAWQAALDHGIQRIEDVAMDRALNGMEVPVYSYGKVVGTRTIYNDRLLMFMLRNRAPERFSPADNASALDAMSKARLERAKKQWLQECLALEQEEEEATVEALDALFEELRQRRLANEAIHAENLDDDDDDDDLAASEPPPPPAPAPQPRPRPEPTIRTLKDGSW
ncbi:MAG: hypothetical protein ACXU68_04545 [Croceibacterium sp.]